MPHQPAALLRAYIDETGDRGTSGRASPYFAFACLLIADEHEQTMRAAVSQLRRDFHVPHGRPLHWNRHIKPFSRRQHATDLLVPLRGAMLIYVVVEKAAIPAFAGIRQDHELFYNYAARLMVERIVLATRDWPGGDREVVVRFGHVRGFNHQTTAAYIQQCAARQDPSWVPWRLMHGDLHFDDQAKFDGLQAADTFAGMLNAAISTDEFGNNEPYHLVRVAHLIRSVDGKRAGYGFKWLGNEATVSSMRWWPRVGP